MPSSYKIWGFLVQKQVKGKKWREMGTRHRKVAHSGRMDSPHIWRITRCLHLSTRLNSTKHSAAILLFFSFLYSLIHAAVTRIGKDGGAPPPCVVSPLKLRADFRDYLLCRSKHQAPNILHPPSCGIPDMLLWVGSHYPYLREKEMNAPDFHSKTQGRISLNPMSWVFDCYCGNGRPLPPITVRIDWF